MQPQGPPIPSPGLVALTCFFLVLVALILAAWGWAIRRLIVGRPFLDPPPEGPRAVPWGMASVGATVLLYLGLQYAAAIFAGIATREGLLPKGQPGELPMVTLIAIVTGTNLLIFPAVFLLLRSTSRANLQDFFPSRLRGWGRELRRGFVAFLLLGPIVFGVFIAVNRARDAKPQEHTVAKFLNAEKTPTAAALVVISAIIAAPLAEEVLFRGVLLGWLTSLAVRKRRHSDSGDLAPKFADPWAVDELQYRDVPDFPIEPDPVAPGPKMGGLPAGAWLANAVVAFLFAGMHFEQWPAPIPLFLLALGLGWLAQRTGNLLASIALHMVFNGFSTVLMLFLVFGDLPIEKPPAAVIAPMEVPSESPSPELTAVVRDLSCR